MRKVCEVYLVSSSATDERGVELTFPVSQYEMMDAFEQIHTKSPGDVYWQVDEFYCFDYLAPHLDESMSIFEFNSLTEHLSKLDGYQETALEGLLQMQVNKHMQENGGPITVQELMMLAHNVDHCHVLADIHTDEDLGKFYVKNGFREDLDALQEGGVDAIMFSNEYSLPYLTDVKKETVAAMARVIGELQPEIRIPYGVNVLWDPKASLDLAAATDAKFIREIFTGVYASDFGIWDTNCGETVRHQRAIGAENVKLLFNIVPEAAAYLAARDIKQIAKSTVFNCRPDALCVSGLTAGSATDAGILDEVKKTVPDTVVLANTGCRIDTIEKLLQIADGAVVGTTFKYDGKFENQVDRTRVKAFMDVVKKTRS